ncbi:unnamed protein product [Linum tenue]|uniref:glucan endo-1,3-beta-D-glucosidase n=1 Tax=Linum tenue TaxID=586396 RepID=A0AAV0QJU4_9ROSI|nr:unnamed protein product [Linum tenue]
MAASSSLPHHVPTALTLLFILVSATTTNGSIGVNYGTVADDLPPPGEVARFLLQSTVINRVRIFDPNPELIQAFAHTGIQLTVTVPNDQIPRLANLSFAQQWIKSYIQPYFPATNLVRILVGNEVLSTGNRLLIGTLVPAMQTLHAALAGASLDRRIQISTPHSLGILSASTPPSAGKFHGGYDVHILKPLLGFLRSTNSPFMINPYPFFGCSEETLDYALFRPNLGFLDPNTRIRYTNMLDAQLDAVFSAMKSLGFGDLEIVIAETGWPSKGEPSQIGAGQENAAQYNRNLMRHVNSGDGTPLMPNRTFETYIFSLFNEDLKPGPTCERNFGLFGPDLTPAYDVGILRPTVSTAVAAQPDGGGERKGAGKWCVAKEGADVDSLQRNIDYVCGALVGLGPGCGPIQEGGECFFPDTVRAHAAYAMNAFYQAMGRNDYDCDFRRTGAITAVDPSLLLLKLRFDSFCVYAFIFTCDDDGGRWCNFAGYGNCKYGH